MCIPASTFACSEVEFQIGITGSNARKVFDHRLRQRRPPEVRMQDHPRGVNDLLQGVIERLPQLAFNCSRNSFYSELCSGVVERASINLTAQATENRSDRVAGGGAALTLQYRGQTRRPKDVVH